jgi:hypothetical protein
MSSHIRMLDNEQSDLMISYKKSSEGTKKKKKNPEKSFLSIASSNSMANLSLSYAEHANSKKSRAKNSGLNRTSSIPVV